MLPWPPTKGKVMKQVDWIEQQNTREKVAKLLAKPFARMAGVVVWLLPNGRHIKCAATEDGVSRWAYQPRWDGVTLPPVGWQPIPRAVARVFFLDAARDI